MERERLMISIYDWFGYDLPMKERYHLIKEAGFEGVMLWWSDGFGRNYYRDAPELAREAGLFVENIHAPIQTQNDLWSDNLDGEAITNCYLQCIADCHQFKIPTMVVHLPSEGHPYNDLGMSRIGKIAEKAEQFGINVALENLQNFSNLSHVLEQIDSKRIGFCYDCGHHYHYVPDKDLLSMYGSRLMALHLHDDNGSYGMHGLPFDGTIDWETVMKNIAATGYTGPTAIEAMYWDYEDLTAREFLHKASEKAKRLEALRI
jgi:sugar phosphate isomerase/epimerase